MRETSARRILRAYIRLQAVLLCLTLAALGAVVAAERTQYYAEGAPAAVRNELPLPPRPMTAPRIPPVREWREYLCLLPAPAGNVCGVILSIEELFREALRAQW